MVKKDKPVLSISRRLYYAVKPLLPWRLRNHLRQHHAKKILAKSQDIWPINPSTATPPKNWPGWPENKKFALILTHDVEGPSGLAKIQKLIDLEKSLGFRSSINLIPEGPYEVTSDQVQSIKTQGFEVGVHGLHHDGKLFTSQKEFTKRAKRINHYINEWGAKGFRAPLMHHNLDWLHQLDIDYDLSTFDTDPFEPQPDASGTIYPFFVEKRPEPVEGQNSVSNKECPEHSRRASIVTNEKRPVPRPSRHSSAAQTQSVPSPKGDSAAKNNTLRSSQSGARAHLQQSASKPKFHNSQFTTERSDTSTSVAQNNIHNSHSRDGYVELPYTLPQDSTLFLVLRETTPIIWIQKLDWIAQQGGMALLNVHPDYIQFEDEPPSPSTYPVSHYREFLEHIKETHQNQYWHTLPCDAAAHARQIRD